MFLNNPTQSTLKLRPGLDLLAGTLVRCAAHKVCVPYRKPRFMGSIDGPKIEDVEIKRVLVKEITDALEKLTSYQERLCKW